MKISHDIKDEMRKVARVGVTSSGATAIESPQFINKRAVGASQDVQTPSTAKSKRQVIVLIHGFASHRYTMKLLEIRLRRMGFETLTWGYWTIGRTVEQQAVRFGKLLKQLDEDETIDRIDVVSHSMGGIITRAALQKAEFEKLNSIVMLVPPNRGSHVARKLSRWLGYLYPALRNISDQEESFVRKLAPVSRYQWAVIAAEFDRVVELEAFSLPHKHAYKVLPTGHMRVLLRRDTCQLVSQFLKQGCFASA